MDSVPVFLAGSLQNTAIASPLLLYIHVPLSNSLFSLQERGKRDRYRHHHQVELCIARVGSACNLMQ